MIGFIQQFRNSWQRLLTVGNHSYIGLHILVNLTMVDIQMNHLSLFGVGLDISCHTIRETHTDSNQYIAFLFLQVGCVVAVHTQHTNIKRMGRRQCREAQHRSTSRDIGLFEEAHQFLLGISQFHTLSYQCQWFLGVIDEFGSFTHSLHVKLRVSHIRTDKVYLLRFELHHLCLGILREVEHHRTRTTTTGDIERTTDGPCNIFGMTYLITPFGDRLGHTHKVYLLEGIRSQCSDGHLTGNHHNRC